ncbi:MAG: radical SAM protein [Candidatus Aminicenantes bacterium]|nr:MAG: radical SAM protein [Candidatus Aminicenantes bacterium]
MVKHNIYLCQVNNRFGKEVFLPYSVGAIQAYCQQFDQVTRNFEFKEFIYLREEPGKIANRLNHPKIVGISCYIWNWQFSKALAKNIKSLHNDCLIIMGGPQVPNRSNDFFYKNPFVDILVHNEGEISFYEVLEEFLQESPDYTKIPGLSVKIKNNRCYKSQNRERNEDMTAFPSPYLIGVFDDLMKKPYKWNACHETNRGCPYSCTYCDWGSAVFSKVTTFEDERLGEELEWFGKHKIEILYNCDANYGMLKRDYQFTQKLADVKRRFGFPVQFRPTYAKNSNVKIFEMVKILNSVGLQKGVTLSMQSMNDECLGKVRRKNIKIENLEKFLNLYRLENIPTYTEMIIGLPGETYDTFKAGIDKLFKSGQHEGLHIYLFILLPNSEISKPRYIKEHGLKYIKTPMLLAHAAPNQDKIQEYFNIVVETNDLPAADWKKCFLFSWVVQCFHCLNLTQYLALFFQTEFNLAYDHFYESLLEFARNNPGTLIGQQYLFTNNVLKKVLIGEHVEIIVPQFGQMTWEVEEASFLNLIYEKDKLYIEIADFLSKIINENKLKIEEDLLSGLVGFQKNMVVDPLSPQRFAFNMSFDFINYFNNAYWGNRIPLDKRELKVILEKEREYIDNLETYALEIVRYGRKSNKLHHKKIVINNKKERTVRASVIENIVI